MENYKNILIIKMSSLGDILHALPTLAALRENWPNARIVWAVHKNFSAVLPGKPYLDDVVYVDRKRLKSPAYWLELRRTLHAYHFDLALDLQGLAKSALVSVLSGAKHRYGYWDMREGSFLVSKGLAGPHKRGHIIEQYLDTVRALGGTVRDVNFPLPDISQEKQRMRERFAASGIDGDYVAVVPGARWNIREWPLDHWQELLTKIAATGMNVLLLGSKDDAAKGKRLAEAVHSPYVFDYTGQTSLRELMAVIAMSTVFISVDTGPLHIANALKKNMIALFGPTSPVRSGPYGGKNGQYIHTILSPASTITTETLHVKNPEWMKQLPVSMVWETYEKIMQEVRHD